MLKATICAITCIGASAIAGCSAPVDPSASADEALIGGTEFPQAAAQTGAIVIQEGCTAALVSRRHILTAGHCVQTVPFVFNGHINIAQVARADAATAWTNVKIKHTHVYPAWSATCIATQCSDRESLTFPFAPDLAVVELEEDVPTSFKTAVIPRARYNMDGQVFVAGYGCEVRVGGPAPSPPRLKMARTRTLPPERINDGAVHVPPEALPIFANSYLLTPGRATDATSGSLCPGDSGGPLFLSSPVENGPPYPTNMVIGVNAYYTFPDGSGVSAINMHTRLYDYGPTFLWLEGILPASSFVYLP